MLSELPSRRSRWNILRVVPKHTVEVELLSGEFVSLFVHFFSRSYLCTCEESCPFCALGPARQYWYLPAVVAPTRTPVLLELSSTTSADLHQRAKMLVGGVRRGNVLSLLRLSPKKPVHVEVVSHVERGEDVPHEFWLSPLMAIFGLPSLNEDERFEGYASRVKSLVTQRSSFAALAVVSSQSGGVKSRS